MLTSLGFASLLGILGTFAAALWSAVVALGGAPGSALAVAGTRYAKPRLVTLGSVFSFLLEAYLLLAFGGWVTRFVRGFLEPRPLLPAWPLWLVGWYLATAPVLFSGRDAPGPQARDERDTAFALALLLAALGYWLFVRWPGVLEAAWPWLPSLSP